MLVAELLTYFHCATRRALAVATEAVVVTEAVLEVAVLEVAVLVVAVLVVAAAVVPAAMQAGAVVTLTVVGPVAAALEVVVVALRW